MRKAKHVEAALTPLFISIFRLNGALIAAGRSTRSRPWLDQVLAGRYSAWWRTCRRRLRVASIARTIGLTRQSVRSITNELIASGLVESRQILTISVPNSLS